MHQGVDLPSPAIRFNAFLLELFLSLCDSLAHKESLEISAAVFFFKRFLPVLLLVKVVDDDTNKHIHYKYHKVRESIELGLFDLVHVHSNLNVADIFTKALERGLFQKFRQWLLRC